MCESIAPIQEVCSMPSSNLVSKKQIQSARLRLLKMHFESGVGHIGGNLSSLDAMMIVYHEYLHEQDVFVLSKGHSAGALYVTLWSKGYLTEEDLRLFHRDNTLLAGHPPAEGIPEIPFATGSLGHGLSLASGTALGMRFRGVDSRVICLTSDGEWQEGSTWEALIFACHQKLGNLSILVDHNNLQGFGTTNDVASMSPLWERFRGFEADICIIDGHNLDAIRNALEMRSNRPQITVMQTVKGKGVSFLENRMDSHYLPLKKEQYREAISEFEAE
jgi:transketolase